MIYPSSIQPGCKIGVTACSDGCSDAIDAIRMDSAKVQLAKCGYAAVETNNCRTSEKGRSSDADTRVKELMSLLTDEDVKAVIMASGGDYLCEVLPKLDFELIKKHPTWIQGYSDPTGLLHTITTNCEIATIYGCNYGDFGMGEWHPSLYDNLKLLGGQVVTQNSFTRHTDGFHKKVTGYEGYVLEKDVLWRNLRDEDEIVLQGRMLGGCLDVLYNLVGTKYDKTNEFVNKYKDDGIVWYLESFDLSAEQLFTSLWNLKEAGWFEHAKGFVFGRPCFFKSFSGTLYEESVDYALGDLGVPIILDADFGHKPPRMAIMNGAIGTVMSKGGRGSITQGITYSM